MGEFMLAVLTRMVAGLRRVNPRRPTAHTEERRDMLPDGNGSDPSRNDQADLYLDDEDRAEVPRSASALVQPTGVGEGIAECRGRVYIVGAGPGEPDLLTVKGKRCLEEADVIVSDYLVNEELLTYSRPDAERVRLGRPTSGDRLSQDEINRLLIRRGREGKVVVRLKGGDPFIFSRGGEEAEALAGAGVAFEIVPGVTSAIAVPAYAGIPLTHRRLASTVAFVTGHEGSSKEASGIDWKAVAGMGTVVFLMGVGRLSQIVARLVEEGRSPETPVAVIEWGTWPRQRAATGTLRDIREKAKGMRRPAVIVVGEVVRLRNRLAWFTEFTASHRATEAKRKQEAAPSKALKP